MSSFDEMQKIYEKLKQSSDWRDDFKLVKIDIKDGVPVYEVKADDSDPSTINRIIKLNNLLKV